MGSAKRRLGRTTLLIGALALLCACATTDTKVSCEGKLQPINPSTAVKSAMLSKASGQPASGVSP
jgi:hypothetical protein